MLAVERDHAVQLGSPNPKFHDSPVSSGGYQNGPGSNKGQENTSTRTGYCFYVEVHAPGSEERGLASV